MSVNENADRYWPYIAGDTLAVKIGPEMSLPGLHQMGARHLQNTNSTLRSLRGMAIKQTVRTYSPFSPVAMIAFPSETSRTILPCLVTTKNTTRGGAPLEGIVIVAFPVQSAFTV